MKRGQVALMLTPLLDLLIIVIFAQLLQAKGHVKEQEILRLRAESAQRGAESAEEEAKAARQDANNTIAQLDKSLAATLAELETLKKEKNELKSQSEAAMEVEHSLRQGMEELGELFKKQFSVPEEMLAKILDGIKPSDADKVKKIMDEIENSSPDEAVRAARKLNELSNRTDFWDVYIGANNGITLTIGDRKVVNRFVPGRKEQVRDKLQESMTSVPDPKRMVFIILTCHPETLNTPAEWTVAALRDLPNVLKSKLAVALKFSTGGSLRKTLTKGNLDNG